ncbi:hypothetical protein CONPUDRAFT_137449 [Coniophora puteana RWD-64-598 SS2]|uniref:F-box domain-containing protein n=1 Tax=Coniophora puteana (strain RWD-64-598) TaxID=741705 RepID=A0A5M3MR84_CONPW|nr:uncharacterized protein CONPUDRAFT_137449 [Coniophora puteana RWD-64-598 SS2]EIW81577.1 hypothetical protein CONPUDRAFT_137449 [Coniophora puteana RWD-64-598 SS2]
MANMDSMHSLSAGNTSLLAGLPNELLRDVSAHLPEEDLLEFCRVDKRCNSQGVLEFLYRSGRHPDDLLSSDLGVVPLCRLWDREHRTLLHGLGVSLGPGTCQGFTTALESADAARLVRGWVRRFPTVKDVHIQVGSVYHAREPMFFKELAGLLRILAGERCERLVWEEEGETGAREAQPYGLVAPTGEEWRAYSIAHYGKEHPEHPYSAVDVPHDTNDPVPSWYLDDAPHMITLQHVKVTTPTLFMRPFNFWIISSLNASPIHTLELDFTGYYNWDSSSKSGEWFYILDYLRLPSLRKFDLRCRTVGDSYLRMFLKYNPTIEEFALYGMHMQLQLDLRDTPPEAIQMLSGTARAVEGVLNPSHFQTKNSFPNLRRVFIQQADLDGREDLQRALSALGLLSEDPSTPKNVTLALDFLDVAKCSQFIGRSASANANAGQVVVFPEPYLTCMTRLEVTFPKGENFREEEGRNLFESVATWLGKFTNIEEVSLGLYMSGGTMLATKDEEKVVKGILEHAPRVKRAKVTHEGEMRSMDEWRVLYS